MLLSHTVLSELYQEKLVTEDYVKRMKGGGDLLYKPPEVAIRIAHLMARFGHNVGVRQLTGW